MPIFGSDWVPVSPEFGVLKVANLAMGPCESSPVQLGANCEFN